MNQKKTRNLDINLLPPFWINFPKMGQPIRIPDKPNIFLVPIKTPLPIDYSFSDYENQWTIEWAAVEAAAAIGERREHTIVYSFELTPYGDLISEQDCESVDISHFYLPIAEEPEKSLNFFVKKISELPSPGYPHIILISCHNGYNRTGYLIAGYFMKKMQLSSRAAAFLFSKKHPPGIFSQEMIDRLNELSPGDQQATVSETPSYIQPFLFENDPSAVGFTTDKSPNFVLNGGQLVDDPRKVNELSELLNSVIPKKGRFTRISVDHNNNEFLPMAFLWDQERYNKLKSNLKIDPLKDLKITFNPYGSHVFLIIDNIQNDGFFISFGVNQFYFFRAVIEPDVPRPIVCLGIYTSRNNDPILFLTDVLVYGEFYMEITDFDQRLNCIWHYILPKIKILSPFQPKDESETFEDFSLLKIAFRPVTKLKLAQALINDIRNTNFTFDGIPCNGLTIINTNYPVGAFVFAPLMPTLNLLFIMNTPKRAYLYARSSKNELTPLLFYQIENQRAASLNRQVIRVKLIKNKQAISLLPISICKNKLCDTVSYARDLIDFMCKNSISEYELMMQLKEIANKNNK